MKPNLGDLWPGDWPYKESQGVGLKLTGFPFDSEMFIQELQAVSCNPVACRRILIVLQTEGVKYVTVMSALDFPAIARTLAALGVKLEVTPPVDTNPNFGSMADRIALALALGQEPDVRYSSQEEIDEGFKRARTVGSIPAETLGPYATFGLQDPRRRSA